MQQQDLRIPHNAEIERQVIGSALVDRCVPIDAKTVSTTEFFFTENRKLWGVICEMDEENQPIDVADLSARSGRPISELVKMSYDIPLHLESKKAITKLKELAVRRTLQKTFTDIADKAANDDLTGLLEYAENFLKTARADQAKQKGSARIISEVYEKDVFPRLDKFVSGESVKVPFGFARLDQATNGGSSPGELVIFGAKPKSGKSAWLLQIARSQADRDIGAYICSREMLNYENGFRALAQSSDYSINHFRPGLFRETAEKLKYHATQYGQIPLFLDDKSKTVRDIRRELERLEDDGHNILTVYVDYIQLMRGTGKYSNKADMYEDVIYDLKDLATEMEKVVYVNAQFNREGIDAERPKMSDFKGSSAIEMAGNLILFWTLKQDSDELLKGRVGQMWIEAGRNVPYAEFDVCFYGEKAMFSFL